MKAVRDYGAKRYFQHSIVSSPPTWRKGRSTLCAIIASVLRSELLIHKQLQFRDLFGVVARALIQDFASGRNQISARNRLLCKKLIRRPTWIGCDWKRIAEFFLEGPDGFHGLLPSDHAHRE